MSRHVRVSHLLMSSCLFIRVKQFCPAKTTKMCIYSQQLLVLNVCFWLWLRTSYHDTCGLRTAQISILWVTGCGESYKNVFIRNPVRDESWSSIGTLEHGQEESHWSAAGVS